MEETRENSVPSSQPYWKQGVTPDYIKVLTFARRLSRLRIPLLDVHDVKDLLHLRCLRFAERLFALIDLQCTGFVSVEDLTNFVYSFEANHLQFRLYMIFHCYDPTSRGYLTNPEIKTMFMENFLEGGCEMGHRSVEYLMDTVLSQFPTQGPLISYPQLLEIAMYHPQLLCHLTKSKLPPKTGPSRWESHWQGISDAAVDHSGRLLLLSMFLLVLVVVFSAGMVRYPDDELAKVLGWAHVIGRSTSDLFKVLIGFFALTLCNFTPFLYKKLPRTLHVRPRDNRVFRKVVLAVMLFVVLIHSVCQTLNMGRLSRSNVFHDQSSSFHRQNQPTIQSLLRSNVFISGFLFFLFFAVSVIFAMLEDYDWSFQASSMTRLRSFFYSNGKFKVAILAVFMALTATHSSTTFVRSCFRLPCLFWLWLGFPALALFLDHVIFKLLDPASQVEVMDYRMLPNKGLMLTISKPVDCRLGAVSSVTLSFPRSSMSAQRSFPVLSHPSENYLTVLIRAKDTWSVELLHHFQSLDTKPDAPVARDSGDSAAVEAGDSRNALEVQRTRDQVSPNIAHCHIPDRLTRLNTRVVYLTQTQRIIGTLGDDPQAVNAESRPFSESTQQQGPRRSTGNFNVIFEITPASLSTEDSLQREEQRVSARQVTDEAIAVPVSSSLVSDSLQSGIQIGLRTFLRGPYKLNNAFHEENLLVMLSYPVLFLVGHNFTSLPLIPLCSYLLRRKPVGQRDRSHGVTTHKIVLSWEIDGFDDLLWLLEGLEPLYDLRSLIRLEVHVHIHHCLRAASSSALFYDLMERTIQEPFLPKLVLDTRAALSFGRRDWEYQLVSLRGETHGERVGVMVDGPQFTQRQIHDWIQANAADQFYFLSLGIISI